MSEKKLVTLRIHTAAMVPLEATVHAHEADVIFDAWLGDAPEVVIPAANGATLPLSGDEVRTIEVTACGRSVRTVCAWTNGSARTV